MKLFSDCHDYCCVCRCSGGNCLAGHGDDNFVKATEEQLLERYNSNLYTDRGYINRIKQRLLDWYNIEV